MSAVSETKLRVPHTLLNAAILSLLFAFYASILWLASSASSLWWVALAGPGFALTMVPIYSLFHECCHGLFARNPRVNYFAGVFLGMLFGVSFSFMRRCHRGHHRRNRSDFEMFDLFYPWQNKIRKTLYLWFLMIGFYWFSLPLSCVAFLFFPRILGSRFINEEPSIKAMVGGLEENLALPLRLESAGVLLFFAALVTLLELQLVPTLILYACHAILWSSQNYVNHAFSPRDTINGAHNHRMNRLLQRWVYLNFNCHLAHHRNPDVPWLYLERLVEPDTVKTSYLRNWLRLWKGPELTHEPPPRAEKLDTAARSVSPDT